MKLPKHAFLALLIILVGAYQSSAATIYSQTQSGSVSFPDSTPVVLTFTGAPPAATDATLTLTATGGELNLNNKRLEQLKVEGDTYQTPGSPAGWIRPANLLDDQSLFPAPVTIPLVALTGYTADGQVVVSVVRPNFISGGTFDLVLEYTSSVPEPTTSLLLMLGVVSSLLPGRCWRS